MIEFIGYTNQPSTNVFEFNIVPNLGMFVACSPGGTQSAGHGHKV